MAVKQNELIVASKLHDELDRLAERFSGKQEALEVIDAVRFWLMEEQVPGSDE